ncbi:cytochrome P450 [Microbacterium sp. A93]|uniref:cytochrome P450 n=1 Tax=Microbacterium sp. A93 TaxID=3450716 RepID=UPI003F42DDBD
MSVESKDILSPELIEDSNSYWADLRAHDPVHWDAAQRAWLLTRYDDVVDGFMDPRLSSDRIRPLLEILPPERRERLGPMLEVMGDWLSVTDAPVHTRLRKLANNAFRGQQIARMAEWMSQLVDELIDDFIASGSTDFIEGIASPLPATVVARMMGAPASDGPLFRKWSDELALVAFSAGDKAAPDRYTRALTSVGEMQDYLRDLIDKRKTDPRDDMISALMTPTADGDVLTEAELLSMCTLILFAGHETTTNLLCNFLVILEREPHVRGQLLTEPSLINTAIEEVLRYEAPIKVIVRWVAESHERGGKTLNAGDRAYLVLHSANRDESIFENADTFDIRRPTQPSHIAFGRGAHACLGAQLARIEARIALPKIFERLPGLRVTDNICWKPLIAARAVTALHVEYDSRETTA